MYVAFVAAGLMIAGGAAASDKKDTKKEVVAWAVDDLKWEAMKGGPPGVMTVTLWGDQGKGPYGALTKFPAGFKAPLHIHTNTTKIVVIKGSYTLNGKIYGPGSYVSVPGGVKHESAGLDASESIFFIEQAGKFDIVMDDAAKTK
jgi:anti-sigma factor ChrR (cupin superfamily)